MHPFCIDPATGNLVFPSLNAVVERMSQWKKLPEPLKPLLGAMRGMSTGWAWPIFSDLCFENHPIGLSLGYNNRRLEMVSFSLLREPLENGEINWPTYEESMAEEKILRAALEKQLRVPLSEGGGVQFSWGSAYCLYHPKDAATSAGINYTFFR